jgi:multidrug efflux pump
VNISSNMSAPFIRRPVATSLLSAAILLAGALAFKFLPVAPLPQVDFPTISVNASLPGASPETMASAVATPLERQFGRIAAVSEMTSSSQLGSTSITLQFDLNRNVDAASRDVQAGINAAAGQLPADLPSLPTWRKQNPADSPIMILAMTSTTIPLPEVYDSADSIIGQKLSQIDGMGIVSRWGGAQPAVRVQANPTALNSYGISLETIRTTLNTANAISPKGQFADANHTYYITDTDQIFKAKDYQPLLVGYHNGAPVRLSDVALVTDSQIDRRNDGLANGEPAVSLVLFKQPNANIIETVDHVYEEMPELQASVPPGMHLQVILDRTTTIRASINDVERSMVISVVLVVLVVFVFLRSGWATVIPSVAVPLSLVGTFGVMYMLGYSLDNLSLMALTISTGFVVDDAIVVIENVTRYLEMGMKPLQAAYKGASEIGFTVISMSTSLVAVFIPILMMGGIIGRLFREFAVTLSTAIAVSLVVSLTTTPMMCAKFLKHDEGRHGWLYRLSEKGFNLWLEAYDVVLRWVLGHQPQVLFITILTVCLNVALFVHTPKGFFPQQDTGRLNGSVTADQDTSFPAMDKKMQQFAKIVQDDPAVDSVNASTGGGGGGGGSAINTARMFVQLKELEARKIDADGVINRLRGKLAKIPGAVLVLQSVQDVRVGARGSSAQYQYTIQADHIEDLTKYAPLLLDKMSHLSNLITDVTSDQQTHGLESYLAVDRDAASRMGVSMTAIDNTLNDAFGQRQVSNLYMPLNQYHVVLELNLGYLTNPDALKSIYVPAGNGTMIPLSAFSHYENSYSALQVNHQGQVPSITISFNMAKGAALGDATDAIHKIEQEVGLPPNVRASFQGTAQAFEDSLSTQPMLILTALTTVYIVLGILYESYIHPITILSTLPSAGVGALLAIQFFKTDLNVIALIGILLLIGIVKKNAILMIDFAIGAQRMEGMPALEAIHKACLLRFRPIMMTTLAALFGALPLALGSGTGSELRRPLGITIVGGLILSQALTLFTTPVVYLYMDRMQEWFARRRHQTPAVVQPAH